jgi:hypothetical protein
VHARRRGVAWSAACPCAASPPPPARPPAPCPPRPRLAGGVTCPPCLSPAALAILCTARRLSAGPALPQGAPPPWQSGLGPSRPCRADSCPHPLGTGPAGRLGRRGPGRHGLPGRDVTACAPRQAAWPPLRARGATDRGPGPGRVEWGGRLRRGTPGAAGPGPGPGRAWPSGLAALGRQPATGNEEAAGYPTPAIRPVARPVAPDRCICDREPARMRLGPPSRGALGSLGLLEPPLQGPGNPS